MNPTCNAGFANFEFHLTIFLLTLLSLAGVRFFAGELGPLALCAGIMGSLPLAASIWSMVRRGRTVPAPTPERTARSADRRPKKTPPSPATPQPRAVASPGTIRKGAGPRPGPTTPPAEGTGTERYVPLPEGPDLGDIERGFSFRFDGGDLELTFVDWRGRERRVRFAEVCRFSYFIAEDYRGFTGGGMGEILNSAEARQLTTLLEEADPLRHLIVSNDRDEWCEIIAAGYRVAAD